MKKVLSLTVIIIILIGSLVYAQGLDYYIEDYGFTISMPEGWHTITRDSTANDPVFDYVSLEHDSMMAFMKRYLFFIYSVREDRQADITIKVEEHEFYEDIHNFSLQSEKKLNDTGETLTDGQAESHVEEYNDISEVEVVDVTQPIFYGYEIVKSGAITYIAVDLSQDVNGKRVYSKQYSTVVNGYYISIVLKSYSGKIQATDMVDFERTVNSLKFDEITEKKETSLKTMFGGEGNTVSWMFMGIGFLVIGYSLMRMNRKKKKKSKK